MANIINMLGNRYGKIVVTKESHRDNGVFWVCLCDCGNTSVVNGRSLRSGSTRSCGCGSKEQARRNSIATAKANRLPYPYIRKLKDLYRNMGDRCENRENKRFSDYGGRGISVCSLWKKDRRSFYKWCSENGYEPGLSIDRIGNNRGYSPENCRFVDAYTQANNTRRNVFVTCRGETKTVGQWSREVGMNPSKLRRRLLRGWEPERAIFDNP